MAGTNVEFTASSAHDLQKHLMEVFEEATKVCDKETKEIFAMIGNYEQLNNYAIKMFCDLANVGFADQARELFKPVSNLGMIPDVAVLTIVIDTYINAGKTKAALKVFHHMLAIGVSPTSYTYTILIRALSTDSSDANSVGLAKKYFMEMLEKGLNPHSFTYFSVFEAIACRESMEKATEFFDQIQAKGFGPLIQNPNGGKRSHSFLAGSANESSCARYGQCLPEAMKLMKLYADLAKSTTDKDMQKWLASKRDFKKEQMRMCDALEKDGNVEEVREVSMSLESRIQPMVLIYTSVIETYLSAGKIKGALEVYKVMSAAGVAPNSYTYTVLIKGLAADPHFFGYAKKCLLEMMDKGKRPNAATYTVVIEGFAKQEDKAAEEEGKQLVELMMSKGFVPNAKAMMGVLKGRPTPVIRRIMNIVLSQLKG